MYSFFHKINISTVSLKSSFAKYIGFSCCLLFFSFGAFAQNQSTFQLKKIHLNGNKWTNDIVVLRELNFKEGESYTLDELQDIKQENVERLKNIGLFNYVDLVYDIDSLQREFDINIELIENWYIFPGVIFELADRNFAEWWTNQNRDLTRINYGIRLDHLNMTGRRDRMVFQFQRGFRKKYELVYNQPYLNKKGTLGAEAFIHYSNQDQIPYKTENNRTIYGGFEDRTLLERFRTGMAIFYRPKIYSRHVFRLEYHKNSVDEHVIQELNPSYFLNGRTSIQFFMFNYHYTYDKRIAQFYPESGYMLWLDLKKEGFGIFNEYNNTSLALGAEYYYPISSRLVAGMQLKLKANLDRRVVSFANNTAIGWRTDNLGGYYLYVVDGTDYVYTRNNLRYSVFDASYNLGKYMPLRQFKKMDIQLYARVFLDMAYVNDPTYREIYNNDFNNRPLIGYGPAIDLVLYNNYMASISLGRNHLREMHYFFQYRTNF